VITRLNLHIVRAMPLLRDVNGLSIVVLGTQALMNVVQHVKESGNTYQGLRRCGSGIIVILRGGFVKTNKEHVMLLW